MHITSCNQMYNACYVIHQMHDTYHITNSDAYHDIQSDARCVARHPIRRTMRSTSSDQTHDAYHFIQSDARCLSRHSPRFRLSVRQVNAIDMTW